MDNYRKERRGRYGPETRALGQRVRRYRELRGMSQTMLCMRAQVSPETMRTLEGGETDPTFSVLAAVAGALGVPLPELVGGGAAEAAPEELEAFAQLAPEDRRELAQIAKLKRASRMMDLGVPAEVALASARALALP